MSRHSLPDRPHCTCVEVQNIELDEAARRLKCGKRRLSDSLKQIPHQRIGGQRVLCMCELRIAMRLFTVLPAPAVEADTEPDTTAAATVTDLSKCVPSGSKRRRSKTG